MDSIAASSHSATGQIARKAILGMAALIVALLLAGAASIVWRGYYKAIDEARLETATLAKVLDEHAQRTLRLIEVTVEGLAGTLSSEIAADQPDIPRVAQLLDSRRRIARDVLNIFLIDADGRVVTDAFGSTSRNDVSERDYIRFHRQSTRDGIFVSEPVMSLAGRGRVVVVSHRLFKVDGGFAGVVAASVSTEYFQSFYRTIDIGALGVIALRTRAGAIVARQPPNRASESGRIEAASTVADAVAAGQTSGTEDYTGRNDGVRRITSYRAVAGSPYIVSVSRAHADFLAPWWDELWRYAIAAGLLVAVMMAASWFLLRQMTARETADAAKRDIESAAATAKRRSAEQEHAARERLQTILDRMPLGCLVSDKDLRMTYWNPAAEKIFGCKFEDVKGQTPFETGFILTDRAIVEALHARLRRGEMTGHSVATNRTRDGRTITCEWTNTPLMRPDGTFQGVLAICQDITERKLTEEALRQSAKMDSLGQLTGGVAHDFNNLLLVIMANVDMVEAEVEDRPGLKGALEAALGAATRGAELTRQLLAFSRRQALEPKVVHVNALVEAMTRLLARTIGETIRIDLRTSPDTWPVQIDPTQLESALANLVVNARDAMPDGGRLVIETANAPLDEAYAAQHADVTAGDYVALSVSDTGTGMPPEVVERVFEPFFTTKEVGKGTGLGMSMVFGFVKQSGGHIRIYSEVGIGTTIRLYLPRAASAASAPADPPTVEVLPAAESGEVILLVEDDADVRESVVVNLRRFGYQVLVASDGPEALEILDRGERIDLLFTDLVMPGGMNGAELARRARETRPTLKVLLTSGYAAPALATRMREIEGAAVLSKPYRVADLAREVRAIIDRA